MRHSSTTSLACGIAYGLVLLATAGEAKAQYAEHRLLAYAHSSLGPPGSVRDLGLPETSTLAQYDVANETGALLIMNRAQIDTDTGAMTLKLTLRDVVGDQATQPFNDWNIYVGFEEKISATTTNKTGLKVNLPRPLAIAAVIDTPSTGLLTVRAVLETRSSSGAMCRGTWVQQHAGPNRQPQPGPGAGEIACATAPAGWTAVVDENTGITIDMPDMGPSIAMMGYYQIDFEDLSNIHELDAEVQGSLSMIATGGTVVGKSATFLTKGKAPPSTGDGGTGTDAGTPNGSPDGGASNPGVGPNDPNAPPPPADDGGCNTSGASASRGIGFFGLLALAFAAIATRRRRPRG